MALKLTKDKRIRIGSTDTPTHFIEVNGNANVSRKFELTETKGQTNGT